MSLILSQISDADNSPSAKMMRRLDELMVKIKTSKEPHAVTDAQAEARGVASCLAILLCCSIDEIREVAGERYAKRKRRRS